MSRTFKVTMPYEDYLAANWLMVRRNWLWRGAFRYVAFVGGLISSINFATSAVAGKLDVTQVVADVVTGLVFAVGALVVTFLWLLWCIPRAAKKAYAQLFVDGVETTYNFGETGIHIANSLGTSDFEWRHITKWVEDDRLILLFRTRLMFFCIPKNQIDAETKDALIKAMSDASVPTR